MWFSFAFVFMFLYLGLFTVNTNFHHVNEVFNAFSHDHVYHSLRVDIETNDVYFAKEEVRTTVREYFDTNIQSNNYEHKIIFYTNLIESAEHEQSRYFTVQLFCPLGFGANYDKTFAYYVT